MSTVEVRYISKDTVKPTSFSTATQQRIELTPWDLNMLTVDYIQKGLLFQKPKQPNQIGENAVISHLKTSFARTLDYFFPFTGRLVCETHNTSTIFLECNMAGAEFIHAVAPQVTVADVLDPLYIPRVVHSFFPLNGVINYDGTSQPLLSVQVTELVDGIFIGCTMNHTVCDGTSFWHFMNSWSEISRNFNHTPRLPVLERWFFSDTDRPIRFPSSSQDQFIERFTPPPFLERMFNFSSQNLAKLKSKANAEQGTNKISSLQALLGFVWRAVMRARCLNSNQEVIYGLLIGNRARLNPALPEEYFGNSVQIVTTTAKAGELLERGLGWAAWLLNQAVTTHNEAGIRISWENWVKKPAFISRGNNYRNSFLITGSSPRFNMYGNDFGWGRPIAVRSGVGNKGDGKITVYQGAIEGSVDVEACLSPQTLMAMADDEEFMEAVTIITPHQSA